MDGLGEHIVYRYHDDITGETFEIGLMGRTPDEVISARINISEILDNDNIVQKIEKIIEYKNK